jgi:hypothetical protein
VSDAERSIQQSSERGKTANAGLAFLVCLAWYGVVVLAFLWYADSRSNVVPEACDDSLCFSQRDGWLTFGLFFGASTLFVSLLVSLLVLGLLAARTRIRSAAVLGSLAASPVLLPTVWVATAIVR